MRALWVLFAIIFIFNANQSYADLPSNVVFQGPDALVATYSVNVGSTEKTAQLVARVSGQPDVVLLSLMPGGLRTGEVTAQNLPLNSQVTIACQHYDASNHPINPPDTVAQATLGPTAGGDLKFDYTIDGSKTDAVLTIDTHGLQVEPGATITLKNLEVKLGSSLYLFYIEGHIVPIKVTGGPIYIDSKNTILDIENLKLDFGDNCTGSSVTGAKNCTFQIYGPVAISDFSGGSITIKATHAGSDAILLDGGSGKSGPDYLDVQSPSGPVVLSNLTTPAGISMKATASGMLTLNNCVLGLYNQISCAGDATLNMNACRFTGAGFGSGVDLKSGKGNINNCQIAGTEVHIEQGKFSFDKCLFYNLVTVNLSDTYFMDCVFRDRVEINNRVGGDDKVWPGFLNCSFCGRAGINNNTPSEISVAHNYFGDPAGPNLNVPDSFLKGGAVLNGQFYDYSLANGAGAGWKQKDITPTAWLRGVIGGQVSLGHGGGSIQAFQNEDFLISVDVGVTDSQVDGADVYLIYDGKRIDPVEPFATLHRDVSQYKGGTAQGFNTANFIMNEAATGTHYFDVYADMSKITGYDTPGINQKLTSGQIPVSISALNSGSVRMKVVPVKISLTGYAKDTPAIGAAMEGMRKLFYSMTSLTSDKLEFRTGPDYTYTGGFFPPSTQAAVLDSIAAQIDGSGIMNSIFNYNVKKPLYIFAPVASANINSLGGSYSSPNRSVIFFDQDKPAAAFREMANHMGTKYSSASVPFNTATAFSQSDFPATSMFGGTCMDRISHQVAGKIKYQDITGNNPAEFWMLPEHANDINVQLHTFLSTTKPEAASASADPIPPAVQSPPDAGTRRVLIWGALDLVPPSTGDDGGWKFEAGSLRAIDVTDTSKMAYPAPYWSYKYRYMFEFYKKSGTAETLLNSFNVAPADVSLVVSGKTRGMFMATFDIQSAFDILRVKSIWEGNKLVFEIPAAAAITQSVTTAPKAGQTLTGNVSMKWSATGGAHSKASAINQPLQHMVLASSDGGASWQVLNAFLETTTVTLNTDSLDMGTYKFRIISSDGIRVAKTEIAGLIIPNRAPKIAIVAPAPGSQAVAGTGWTLLADAWDLEDGAAGVRYPKWTSNLQGVLGQKLKLTNVKLKSGLHTLTFTCYDSKGVTASASVKVRVTQHTGVPGNLWRELE